MWLTFPPNLGTSKWNQLASNFRSLNSHSNGTILSGLMGVLLASSKAKNEPRLSGKNVLFSALQIPTSILHTASLPYSVSTRNEDGSILLKERIHNNALNCIKTAAKITNLLIFLLAFGLLLALCSCGLMGGRHSSSSSI